MNSQKKQFPWKILILSLLAVLAAGMVWYAVLLSAEQIQEGTGNPVMEQAVSEPSGDTGSEPAEDAGSEPSGDTGSEPAEDAGSEASEENEEDAFGADGSYEEFLNAGNFPRYENEPNVPVNGNRPFFTEADYTTESFETYGDLDALGRCTYAFACVGEDLMPTEKRERISQIRPTGWHFTKYDGIDGNYLYNRCHLIAYGLTAENANERNLITGTRYLNTLGMNDLENETISYIRRTGNHVLYRVTPVFEGENLIASGVLMEAQSVENDEFSFCVYAFNVQPGITIDYRTGDSSGTPFTGTEVRHPAPSASPKPEWEYVPPAENVTYILNTKSMKFHRPNCDAVKEMNPKNREDFTGTREEVLEMGYDPCGGCKP